jgi:choline-glycine betaine transporter
MGLNTEARAALVFLILYTILFAAIFSGYITRRFTFRTRYTVILFHVLVRLSSQATGLAFGVVGYSNTNLLVAYFILFVFLLLVSCRSFYLNTFLSIGVLKGTLLWCSAHTDSSLVGNTAVSNAKTAGSRKKILQIPPCTSAFGNRSLSSVREHDR